MNEFFFKTVDIPNIDKILNEIRPYVSKLADTTLSWGYNTCDLKVFLKNNESFSSFVNEYKLSCRRVAIIKIRPLSSNDIHTDYIDDKTSKIALNMCIENCTNSPTLMFRPTHEKNQQQISRSPLGYPYFLYDKDKVEYVTQFNLDKPTLFDVTKPHQVTNNTPKRRLSISFRFWSDPIILM